MKKYKNGKLVTGLTMGLVAVSLVGVGFSTWILTAQDAVENTGNISVEVGDVKDESVKLELAGTNGLTDDNAIRFDAVTESGGLIHGAPTSPEDLKFGITFKVTVNDLNRFKGIWAAGYETTNVLTTWSTTSKYVVSPVKMQVAAAKDNVASYAPLITKAMFEAASGGSATKYVTYDESYVATTTADNNGDKACAKIDIAKNELVYTVTVEYSFKWGETFGFKNPCLHDGNQQDADTSIAGLKEMVKNPSPKFAVALKYDTANEATSK